MLQWCLVFLWVHAAFSSSPPPLTTIAPTPIERSAFRATVEGGLQRLQTPVKVVHLIGASDVEASVDWLPLCQKYGVTFLLVGPKLIESTVNNKADHCVHYLTNLYTKEALADSQLDSSLLTPDLLVGLNVDIYMIYWRRTLGEMLQTGKPIIVTVYCGYEGHKLVRLMKWKEQSFSPQALLQCDGFNKRTPSGADRAAVLDTPEIVTLWEFEPNPHAHAKPKNCYGKAIMEGKDHGVRNSFWIGFQGKVEEEKSGGGGVRNEL